VVVAKLFVASSFTVKRDRYNFHISFMDVENNVMIVVTNLS
jgi:hypothetical protein